MACCGGGGDTGPANDKFSSFSGACYNGNVDKMKDILKKEKDKAKIMNTVNEDGMTPLLRAAQRSSPDVIKLLIENGADVRLASKKTGETPLHIAAFHRNKGVVEVLLETEAKKDVNVQDQHGYTPLLVAVNRGASDVTSMLLKAGGNLKIKDNYGQDGLEMANFLAEQEEQGLSSPSAEHGKTRKVVESQA
eukprot:Lankesteria_metandrocarpae@DN3125_c0_g1_i1.p1